MKLIDNNSNTSYNQNAQPISHLGPSPASSGQVVLETVMLLALVTSIAYLSTQYFSQKQILREVIQAPWKNLAGVIENGLWQPVSAQTKEYHPTAFWRHMSLKGDE